MSDISMMLNAMYEKFKTPKAQAVLELQGEVGFHVSEDEAVDLCHSAIYSDFVRTVALEGITVNISRVRTRRAEQPKGTEFDQYVIVFTAEGRPQQ